MTKGHIPNKICYRFILYRYINEQKTITDIICKICNDDVTVTQRARYKNVIGFYLISLITF
jgi:hypothetical protein